MNRQDSCLVPCPAQMFEMRWTVERRLREPIQVMARDDSGTADTDTEDEGWMLPVDGMPAPKKSKRVFLWQRACQCSWKGRNPYERSTGQW